MRFESSTKSGILVVKDKHKYISNESTSTPMFALNKLTDKQKNAISMKSFIEGNTPATTIFN